MGSREKELGRTLPNSPVIAMLAKYGDSTQKRLKQIDERLDETVRHFQENCGRSGHKFEPVMHEGEKDGSPIKTGDVCGVCAFFVPRRPGPRWVICQNCGGNMKKAEVLGTDTMFRCTTCQNGFLYHPLRREDMI